MLDYENRSQRVAPPGVFLRRLGWNFGIVLIAIALSLFGGMLGYHTFENLDWLDSYDQAAMILSGMGPLSQPTTSAGKFFAGTYALYSGILVVGTSGLILAPIFHRLLHRFHVEDEGDEEKK